MSDELLINLSALYHLVGKWNEHKFDNEGLFLDEVRPVAKKVCEELNKEKKDDIQA